MGEVDAGKGLEPTTIRTRFIGARNVIRAAVSDRFLPRDIAERVNVPRRRKASAAMRIPSVEQVGAAICAAADDFAAYIAVCAFAGLHRGEASALKISDIDFLRKEIHVSRQVQWTDANDRTRKAAADLLDRSLGSAADPLQTEGPN